MKKHQVFHNITIDQDVRFGKPVIEGTRVPVDIIVGKIGGGMTIEEVMYQLTRNQILAALQYAAHVVASEEIATI